MVHEAGTDKKGNCSPSSAGYDNRRLDMTTNLLGLNEFMYWSMGWLTPFLLRGSGADSFKKKARIATG